MVCAWRECLVRKRFLRLFIGREIQRSKCWSRDLKSRSLTQLAQFRFKSLSHLNMPTQSSIEAFGLGVKPVTDWPCVAGQEKRRLSGSSRPLGQISDKTPVHRSPCRCYVNQGKTGFCQPTNHVRPGPLPLARAARHQKEAPVWAQRQRRRGPVCAFLSLVRRYCGSGAKEGNWCRNETEQVTCRRGSQRPHTPAGRPFRNNAHPMSWSFAVLEGGRPFDSWLLAWATPGASRLESLCLLTAKSQHIF